MNQRAIPRLRPGDITVLEKVGSPGRDYIVSERAVRIIRQMLEPEIRALLKQRETAGSSQRAIPQR